MKIIEVVASALGAAMAGALVVVLMSCSLLGFWMAAWTERQAVAVSVAATVTGVIMANVFLYKLWRAEKRRLSV